MFVQLMLTYCHWSCALSCVGAEVGIVGVVLGVTLIRSDCETSVQKSQSELI